MATDFLRSHNRRSGVSVAGPAMRPRPTTVSPRPAAASNGGSALDRLLAQSSGGSQQQQQDDGGSSFGRGFGAIVNNPVVSNVLKPLQTLDIPRRLTISAINEMADMVNGGDASWSDFAEQIQDPSFGFGDVVGDTGNKWLDRGIGLAGDIALDPLTWLTAGVGAVPGKLGRSGAATKLLNAQRAADKAGDAAKLGKLGGLDEVQRMFSHGPTVANKAQLEAMDLGKQGLRFGTRNNNVRIPGTGGVARVANEGFARGRAGFNRKLPGGTGLRAKRSPVGLEDAFEQGVTGRGGMPIDEAVDLIQSSDFIRRGSAGFKEQMARRVNSSKDELKDTGKKMVRESETAGTKTVFNDLMESARTLAKRFGSNIPELSDSSVGTYVPHVLSRKFRDFLKGNPTAEARWLSVPNMVADDLLEESRFVQKRQFRPNADGTPKEFTFKSPAGGDRKITVEKGTIDELNKKLTDAFPEYSGQFYETNPQIIVEAYTDSLARQVGRDYAAAKMEKISPKFRRVGINENAIVDEKFTDGVMGAVKSEGKTKKANKEAASTLKKGVKEQTKRVDNELAENRGVIQEARKIIDTEDLNPPIVAAGAGVNPSTVVKGEIPKGKRGPEARALVATQKQLEKDIAAQSGVVTARMEKITEGARELKATLARLSKSRSGVKRAGQKRMTKMLNDAMDQVQELVNNRAIIRQNIDALGPMIDNDATDLVAQAAQLRKQADELDGLINETVEAAQRNLDELGPDLDPLWMSDEALEYENARKLVAAANDRAMRVEAGATKGLGKKVGKARVAAARKILDDPVKTHHFNEMNAEFLRERRALQGKLDFAKEGREVQPIPKEYRAKYNLEASPREEEISIARYDPDLDETIGPASVTGVGGTKAVDEIDELRRIAASKEQRAAMQGDSINKASEGLPEIEAALPVAAKKVTGIRDLTDPAAQALKTETDDAVRASQMDAVKAKLTQAGASAEHAKVMTTVDGETTRLLGQLEDNLGDRLAMVNAADAARQTRKMPVMSASLKNPAGVEKAIDDMAELFPHLSDPAMEQTWKMLDNVRWNIEQNAVDRTALEISEQMLKKANKNKLHRVYTAQLSDTWSALHKGAIKEGDIVLEAELARRFQNLYKVTEDPKIFGQTLTAFTNFFKTYATLTPGFHVRNGMSAVFMNSSDGVSLRMQQRGLRVWREYVKGGDAWLAKQPEHVQGAFEAAFASGSGGRFFESGVSAGPAGGKATEKIFKNRATVGSQKIGQDWVEGPVRLAMALDSISAKVPTARMDDAVNDALARITRIHFDYSQVSRFDEQARRLIPFWTFMSRNLPMQITQMWSRPRLYNQYNSFIRNVGDEDEPFTPDYFKNIGAFRVSLLDPFIPGDMPIYLQPDFAHTRVTEDLENIEGLLSGENMTRPLSDLNPFFSAPAEFALNQNFFTGRGYEDTDVVKAEGLLKPLIPILAMMGQADQAPNGEWVVGEKGIDMLRSLNPVFDRTARLLPQTIGEGGDVNRQLEAIARTTGLFPMRQLSPKQQQSQARSQGYDERDALRREQAIMRAAAGG